MDDLAIPTTPSEDPQAVYDIYCAHNSGLRIHTDTTIQAALHSQHPSCNLTATKSDLIQYANAGHATATLNEDFHPTLRSSVFEPAGRKPLDGSAPGKVTHAILFARYDYVWQGHRFLVFVVDGQNSGQCDCRCYVLSPKDQAESAGMDAMEALVLAAGIWSQQSHEQVWVYDQGRWSKDKDLYQMVQRGSWEDLILDEGMKRAIRRDVTGFFDAIETYEEFGTPWKVG